METAEYTFPIYAEELAYIPNENELFPIFAADLETSAAETKSNITVCHNDTPQNDMAQTTDQQLNSKIKTLCLYLSKLLKADNYEPGYMAETMEQILEFALADGSLRFYDNEPAFMGKLKRKLEDMTDNRLGRPAGVPEASGHSVRLAADEMLVEIQKAVMEGRKVENVLVIDNTDFSKTKTEEGTASAQGSFIVSNDGETQVRAVLKAINPLSEPLLKPEIEIILQNSVPVGERVLYVSDCFNGGLYNPTDLKHSFGGEYMPKNKYLLFDYFFFWLTITQTKLLVSDGKKGIALDRSHITSVSQASYKRHGIKYVQFQLNLFDGRLFLLSVRDSLSSDKQLISTLKGILS